MLGVLASAAHRLHEERSGSMVLRNPSGPFMRQLRLMRIDHMFELEVWPFAGKALLMPTASPDPGCRTARPGGRWTRP